MTRKLIRQLQGAYSGELAAGYAYRGHWRSVRDAAEREQIQIIEQEEWHHRELVGGLIAQLGAKPNRRREAIFFLIGKTIAGLCHVGGWLIPMYGAGRLESHNIIEYEDAAEYASRCGHHEMIDCLMQMAETERRHEVYFRERVMTHWLVRRLKITTPWPEPRTRARASAGR